MAIRPKGKIRKHEGQLPATLRRHGQTVAGARALGLASLLVNEFVS